MKYSILFLLSIWFVSCSEEQPDADQLIAEAVEVHKAHFKGRKVTFNFRDRAYSVERGDGPYLYTRKWQEDSIGYVEDLLINSSRLTRRIEGDTVELTEEWRGKYTNSVNSVLYFFQIPYILNDKAARKSFVGSFEMGGEPYWGVRITFSEDGGGEDYEDVFLYWIHKETKTIDFMSYSYLTEGGGVRFRQAINRREIGGMIFQDYVNYKADKGTPLEDLPELFDQDRLEELSKIINTDIRVEEINE